MASATLALLLPMTIEAPAIFEKIRDLPYRVATSARDTNAFNCVYKNGKLIEQLGILGHTVRGRIGEMRWQDTPLPANIIALYPSDITATHFFAEMEVDGTWYPLDASWDKDLHKAGFPLCTWHNMQAPALPLVRVYDFHEQAQCLQYWSDQNNIDDYFNRARDFLNAFNHWLKVVRMA